MGGKTIKTQKYNEYRRKRTLYLFLLLFPTIVVSISYFVIDAMGIISDQDMVTIYIVAFIGLLVLLIFMQPRITLTKMYIDYYTMLHDDLKPIKVKRRLYTKEWIQSLQNDGYKVAHDRIKYMLLYKQLDKLSNVGRSNKTMVFIFIAKDKDFDFYSDEADQATEAVYINNADFQKINRQITLQFKSYKTLDTEAKEAVESMILFHTPRQTVVNITCSYIEGTNSLYAPFPKKRYPNRYTYFAGNEIKRLTQTKE